MCRRKYKYWFSPILQKSYKKQYQNIVFIKNRVSLLQTVYIDPNDLFGMDIFSLDYNGAVITVFQATRNLENIVD